EDRHATGAVDQLDGFYRVQAGAFHIRQPATGKVAVKRLLDVGDGTRRHERTRDVWASGRPARRQCLDVLPLDGDAQAVQPLDHLATSALPCRLDPLESGAQRGALGVHEEPEEVDLVP